MNDDESLCRVLTHCTINGQACVAGDTVELAEPQRGFLIAHRMVVLVPIVKARELGQQSKPKRGKIGRDRYDGPSV